MKTKVFLLYTLWLIPIMTFAQPKVLFNAWAEAELSHASEYSHFYFNEIHENNSGWHVGMNNINALATVKLNDVLSINLRGQIARDNSDAINNISLPLANIKYTNNKNNFSLSLGRFITAFGAFSNLQHPKERTFINLPLSYSYYANVSSSLGYNQRIGQDSFIINDNVDWGTTLIYYGAYSDGLLFDWNIKPDKLSLQAAITNHAPNVFNSNKIKLDNYGFNARLKFQPKYFWEQGFSISHGSFFKKMYGDTEFEGLDLRQTLIGTDFKLGFGFWEISGELLAGLYNVPEFQFPEMQISGDPQSLSTVAGYLNIKYELPFVSGLYAAYGFDFISFGELDDVGGLADRGKWDENVNRHQIALGYKITNFLLLRTNFSLQPLKDTSVNNYEDKNLNTWRTSLTVFF